MKTVFKNLGVFLAGSLAYSRVGLGRLLSKTGLSRTVEVGHVAPQGDQQVGGGVAELVVLATLVADQLLEALCPLLLVGERPDLVSFKPQGVQQVVQAGVSQRSSIAGVRFRLTKSAPSSCCLLYKQNCKIEEKVETKITNTNPL